MTLKERDIALKFAGSVARYSTIDEKAIANREAYEHLSDVRRLRAIHSQIVSTAISNYGEYCQCPESCPCHQNAPCTCNGPTPIGEPLPYHPTSWIVGGFKEHWPSEVKDALRMNCGMTNNAIDRAVIAWRRSGKTLTTFRRALAAIEE